MPVHLHFIYYTRVRGSNQPLFEKVLSYFHRIFYIEDSRFRFAYKPHDKAVFQISPKRKKHPLISNVFKMFLVLRVLRLKVSLRMPQSNLQDANAIFGIACALRLLDTLLLPLHPLILPLG